MTVTDSYKENNSHFESELSSHCTAFFEHEYFMRKLAILPKLMKLFQWTSFEKQEMAKEGKSLWLLCIWEVIIENLVDWTLQQQNIPIFGNGEGILSH